METLKLISDWYNEYYWVYCCIVFLSAIVLEKTMEGWVSIGTFLLLGIVSTIPLVNILLLIPIAIFILSIVIRTRILDNRLF